MKRFLFIGLCMMPLLPAPALGWNPNDDCPPMPDEQTKAQIVAGNMFTSAEQNYQNGNPFAALKGFLCSHRIMQHENTLFNIAQISKTADDKDALMALLKAFVNNETRTHVREPIREIIDEVEKKRTDTVDDNTAQETNVIEGNYTNPSVISEASAQGGASARASRGAQTALKISGVSLMVTGAAALVVGGVFQGLAKTAQTTAAQTESYSTFNDEKLKMESFQTGAWIGFISGAAFLASGAIMTALIRKKESLSSNRIAVVPAINGAFFMGRF